MGDVVGFPAWTEDFGIEVPKDASKGLSPLEESAFMAMSLLLLLMGS
jgi:hypothetical protein